MKNLLLLFFLATILFISCREEAPHAEKIEVLFLGHDHTHHNSAKYLPMLQAALAPRGFNFSYTDQLDDLNEANLDQYDALMIYANHDSIAPAQEKALLDFVREGGGILPIHCASYCFRNSEEYVKLVGGQFKSHGTGVFAASIVNDDHPITAGFEAFEAWDETYVHDKHQPNRTVLMERVEGDQREPWTWVSKYGDGRVFYTASGHDERVWGHPGFHDLIERGLLWAVNDRVRANYDLLEMPELAYVPEDSIPNYEKRDPPPQLQKPLGPEASMQHIQLPTGFELQLFASEPDIINPIAMAWDERGRLWVVETQDYPNDIKTEEGQGSDRIKICEDTDGDGRADKFTVFADRLSVPTSLVFSNGGVIISQAPHFLFLKDEDGDDKADLRRALITGWGTFDTHAGPSNLKYGFDNNIWGVLGYSGFEGRVGDTDHNFRQGVYKFKPDGSHLEKVADFTNNTWGLGFSETNDIFGSTANNEHAVYVGIPLRYYEGVRGLPKKGSKKIDGHYEMHSNTPNIRQVDVHGGFTAAAGFNLYTARSFPKKYWNRIALVCEPTGHLLHLARLEKDGAGFREKDGWNLLASSDEWVSPVHAEVGPDGAVWVLDWYNFIIQHNPTPEGFENGRGNAHINRNRDYQHGRIYRISHKDGQPTQQPRLEVADPSTLVAALNNDNMLWRMHAQRLLVERGEQDIYGDLLALVEDQGMDELGQNNAAVHALWTLHGLGAFAESHQRAMRSALMALRHPAAGVRKAAIQVLPKDEKLLDRMRSYDLVNDKDPHTRLVAILALSEMDPNPSLGATLYALSQYQEIQEDQWLAQAVYIAAARHRDGFMQAFRSDPAMKDHQVQDERYVEPLWQVANLDDSDWREMSLPGRWDQKGFDDLKNFDGVIWYRRTIDLKPEEARAIKAIVLGPIDDSDTTWINGRRVGSTNGWDDVRKYNIAGGLLKAGTNQITVKVKDDRGRGGLWGEPDQLYLERAGNPIPLTGNWKFKISRTFDHHKPFFEKRAILDEWLKLYESDVPVTPVAEQSVEDPNTHYIYISTVREQMQYDLKEFTVKAGETVELVFQNNDAMQHNLLIIAPGRLEDLGAVADNMATTTDAAELDYVPPVSYVLHHTQLVNPGETVRLNFTAPAQPGEYPYVCTFPGHWRMMNGVMKVVGEEVN